ncbi:MAG: polyprenyl diphosphate synthase [Kiritimatiellae bacterium]|nr:polyprenyl diphosphate synthase [Kiritimatiellia bacterium]
MEHLAVIMDGNGRWATSRLKPRIFGHRAGAQALDRVMHYCKDAGIKYLTVYAFSTENWKRSEEEVSGLMTLLSTFIKSKEKELLENGVRFRVIGRRTDLSEKLQKEIAELEEKTKGGAFTLVVALSYGSRDEIVRAAMKFKGSTEEEFAECLDTAGIPDPDLIIRTSGELRLSNFLMWQAAYSEFYFTDKLWPDFDKEEFDKALESFSKRERRMGGRLK